MLATLGADLSATATEATLSGALNYGSLPKNVTIDSEFMILVDAAGHLVRGASGTNMVAHSSGASLVAGWVLPAATIPLSTVLTTNNDAGGQAISDIADPTDPTDAANKEYVDGAVQTAFYEYDFSVSGGAQGTIALTGGAALAANQFVQSAVLQVITPFTSSGSATVALTTGESANDIQTAVAYNNAAYSSGFHVLGSVNKLITQARTPSIVIGTAALTAGKIKLLLNVTSNWS